MISNASRSQPLPSPPAEAAEELAPRSVEDDARIGLALEQHFDCIWRSLRRLGVDEHGADDAAQHVFLQFSRRIREIEPGFERAYLLGIAVKVAANARRSRARRPEEPSDALDDYSSTLSDPESLLQQAQRRRRLDDALSSLSSQQREVFVLFELEGFSLPEIARALEIPLGTATSRLRRARDAFEAWVAAHLPRAGEP